MPLKEKRVWGKHRNRERPDQFEKVLYVKRHVARKMYYMLKKIQKFSGTKGKGNINWFLNHLASCTKNLELYIEMMHCCWTILKKEVKTRLVFLVMVLYMHVQFSSVQSLSRPWLCDSMNHSTPGLPVHHQLPESTQTHTHRVGDAIQPSHPLSSPFSSCPQSFPTSGSFQMSQLFTLGGMRKDKLCRKKLKSFKTS